METYSKAMNAGQYPLSILAMTEKAAELYRTGVYGNTMTANPRAMDVGAAVLEGVRDRAIGGVVVRVGDGVAVDRPHRQRSGGRRAAVTGGDDGRAPGARVRAG